MPLILILRPLECFAIVGAELKRVMSLGQFMAVEGTVRSQQVEDGQDGLRRLAELCEQLRIENYDYSQSRNAPAYKGNHNSRLSILYAR